MNLYERLMHGWNAFLGRDPTRSFSPGTSYSTRPDRRRTSRFAERSLAASAYNRIAVDAAQVTIEHAKLDDNDRFLETIPSGLNSVLTLEANLDQTGQAFLQDAFQSMLDEGVIAIVPVDTDLNPDTHSFDVLTARVGRITQWKSKEVKVELWNEETGKKEELWLPKKTVAICENPFYSIMNEPNSTYQRRIRKLALLDAIDEQSGSGKLDLIIQLPYTIKTEARRKQAENRRKEIEMQLTGSKYGIAYTDGTERITQLNRAVENNLLAQIEYLTTQFYTELGVPDTVLNGTADEQTMLNYNNRIITPIVDAVVNEMRRKFLSKNARTRKQSIVYHTEPFKLVPAEKLADLVQKLTTAEVMSPNEFRQIIGLKPSADPKADELRNRNLNEQADAEVATTEDGPAEQTDAM